MNSVRNFKRDLGLGVPIGGIKLLFVSMRSIEILQTLGEKIFFFFPPQEAACNMDFLLLPNVTVSSLTTLTYYLQLTVYSMFNGHTL